VETQRDGEIALEPLRAPPREGRKRRSNKPKVNALAVYYSIDPPAVK